MLLPILRSLHLGLPKLLPYYCIVTDTKTLVLLTYQQQQESKVSLLNVNINLIEFFLWEWLNALCSLPLRFKIVKSTFIIVSSLSVVSTSKSRLNQILILCSALLVLTLGLDNRTN